MGRYSGRYRGGDSGSGCAALIVIAFWLIGLGFVVTFWGLVIYALYLLVTGQLHIG